jgi:hypothetical protein
LLGARSGPGKRAWAEEVASRCCSRAAAMDLAFSGVPIYRRLKMQDKFAKAGFMNKKLELSEVIKSKVCKIFNTGIQ